MNNVIYPQQQIPVRTEYDLLVCGSGLGGIAAAVNAARDGLKVGMIEYFGKPGGVPVTGLLGVVSGYCCGKERIRSAFMDELVSHADKRNGVCNMTGYMMFDPEVLGMILLEILHENDIEIHFYTQLVDAIHENGNVRYAVTSSKAGITAVGARLFVDNTGDGDMAVKAGCRYMMGRKSDGKVQSTSVTFKISGIESIKVPETMNEMTEIWRKHPQSTPTDHVVIKYMPERNGRLDGIVNMTHILDCNPLDPVDQARARNEGTRQAFEILEFFQKHVAGFENTYISGVAEQLGVRESRRITGDYILTEDDVVNGRDFPDTIARCGWGIDVHNPIGVHTGIEVVLKQSYGIPYRCLTPLGVNNLYIAGRPISATHRAFSSSRINSTCVCIGEAVGLAAAEAIREKDIRAVDVNKLQKRLEDNGTSVHRS